MSYPVWRIGDLRLTRIVEMDASAALQEILADADPAALARAQWLSPDYLDSAGRLSGVIQSFVIEGPDGVTIVDTCVGNGKHRSGPPWDQVASDFLTRLARDLVDPADVRRVVCTHLHFDHVGWNTRMQDGVWVPTFPNARYVLCDKEFRYWHAGPANESEDHRAGVLDSLAPIADAGLLESRGERALVTGAAFHHPSQIAYPDWSTISDFDPAQARQSRLDLLQRFAGTGTAFVGTHFSDPAIGMLQTDSGDYFLAPFGTD